MHEKVGDCDFVRLMWDRLILLNIGDRESRRAAASSSVPGPGKTRGKENSCHHDTISKTCHATNGCQKFGKMERDTAMMMKGWVDAGTKMARTSRFRASNG